MHQVTHHTEQDARDLDELIRNIREGHGAHPCTAETVLACALRRRIADGSSHSAAFPPLWHSAI
jgi:hypothetical protein